MACVGHAKFKFEGVSDAKSIEVKYPPIHDIGDAISSMLMLVHIDSPTILLSLPSAVRPTCLGGYGYDHHCTSAAESNANFGNYPTFIHHACHGHHGHPSYLLTAFAHAAQVGSVVAIVAAQR
jgi:hypothetical protein